MIKLESALARSEMTPVLASGHIKVSDASLATLSALFDFIVVAALMIAVDLGYHNYLDGSFAGSHEGRSATILVSSLFVAFQCLQRAYGVQAFLDMSRQLKVLLLGWCAVFFVIGWVGFLLKITPDYSRAVLTFSFVLGLAVIVMARLALTGVLRRSLAHGQLALSNAHLICAGEAGQRERIVREAARNGVNISSVTVVDPDRLEAAAAGDHGGAEILETIRAAYQSVPFNEIYLFLPMQKWRPLNAVTLALGQVPLPVYLFAGEEMGHALRGRPLQVGRLSGFEVQRPPLSAMELHVKRAIDVAIASLALLALSPLLVLTGAAILAESGRPVIFRQSRKGFGERSFTIFKFRTMRVCEDGETIRQATRNDVRVTRLGAVLRRTSIDELPQLFNVLKGDMSIVGPRPHAIAHDHYYDALIATYAYRHHVKPGLTGWAQVNGLRGETRELVSMEDRIKHDIWYINNWSIWLDLQIIARTAATLLLHRQAY